MATPPSSLLSSPARSTSSAVSSSSLLEAPSVAHHAGRQGRQHRHRKPSEALTASLDEVLRLERCYETEAGLVKRREVLKSLNVLVKQWIQSVSLSRGMHWHDIDKIGGRIVTYGSYMLDISHQGADIDALCIAPQHITRAEYFSSFFSLLSYQAEVTDLRSIEEAYVPVLKMRFSGIEIDMTFARLNMPEVTRTSRNRELVCPFRFLPMKTSTSRLRWFWATWTPSA